MRRNELSLFLLLEILAVAWAGLVFKLFESRLTAGFAAGTYFVALGVFMLWRIWLWPMRWRSFTLYPLLVHLLIISVPLMVARYSNPQTPFEELSIWGLPGPVFHGLSTTVFSILILSTIADLSRSRKALAK